MMRRRRMLEDLDQQIHDHLEQETLDNLARGLSPEEARHAALRKFGNVLRIKEDTRAVWTPVWLEQLFQDARYGLRMLRRSPGFNPDEERVPGRDAVMVLAYEVWKHEFAADSSVIGRRLRLNGLDFSVVGVAPESFTGLDQYVRPAFFIPAMMGPTLLLASKGDILTDRSARASRPA